MLVVVASLVSWYFTKYQDRDQVKNNNLNKTDITKQHTLIGDQQLYDLNLYEILHLQILYIQHLILISRIWSNII